MAMRASPTAAAGHSGHSDSAAMHDMASMSMGASMDMSDLDGKEIVDASGEKLAVFNRFSGWPSSRRP
jgi:hypothetical protein